MERLKRLPRHAVALCALVLLAACGGGGDTAEKQDNTVAPRLAELSQDVPPAGARIDVTGRNYFPLNKGDNWTYAKVVDGASAGTITRSVVGTPVVDVPVTLRETEGTERLDSLYRVTSAGVALVDPFGVGNQVPGIYSAMPTHLEYATPFYPAGGTYKTIRQGNSLADFDGDNKLDYFRVEIDQTFLGFETAQVLGQSMAVAHFRSTVVVTLLYSKTRKSEVTSSVEETWLADGIGLVRADRSTTGTDGTAVEPPYSMQLVSATVAQQGVVSSGYAAIAMKPRSAAFDAAHGTYYVSVDAADATHGNRIAKVDAALGEVVYSSAIGSSPGPVAVSADGTVLYVGLDGSGEVVKLALPAMTEVGRVRLPVHANFGQLAAEQITVSPASSNVIAVSLKINGISPRHDGVVLIRNLVIDPVKTQTHTGSNRIAFDATGANVYGYNNETTEFGLRRLEVVANGLVEREVVATNVGFYADLSLQDGVIVVGDGVFTADATLALRGTAANAKGCVKLAGVNKLACLSDAVNGTVTAIDATTFAPLSQYVYRTGAPSVSKRLVGGVGQVAVLEDDLFILTRNLALE